MSPQLSCRDNWQIRTKLKVPVFNLLFCWIKISHDREIKKLCSVTWPQDQPVLHSCMAADNLVMQGPRPVLHSCLGNHFIIKMLSNQHTNSHYKDKTVSSLKFIMGILMPGKTFLYWNVALVICRCGVDFRRNILLHKGNANMFQKVTGSNYIHTLFVHVLAEGENSHLRHSSGT